MALAMRARLVTREMVSFIFALRGKLLTRMLAGYASYIALSTVLSFFVRVLVRLPLRFDLNPLPFSSSQYHPRSPYGRA